MNNILDLKTDIHKNCDYCKKEKKELKIPFRYWSEWLYLLSKYPNKEWGIVFWVNNNNVIDYKIPPQEVTATEVVFKEDLGGDGMLHSHHSMGNGFSSQDDIQARNLYEWNLILSHTGLNGCYKTKLPCGSYGYQDINVSIIDTPIILTENIKDKNYRDIPDKNTTKNYYSEDYYYDKFLVDDNVYSVNCSSCNKLVDINDLSSYVEVGNYEMICSDCYNKLSKEHIIW